MSRIFLALALLAVGLLAANLVVGLVSGDFGESSRAFQQARGALEQLERSSSATGAQVQSARQQLTATGQVMIRQRNRFWTHVWLGIIAVLVTLLVNSISITYFIGTSRWCREVADAYALDERWPDESRRLKRRSFPWALAGIVLTLSIAALGAAADPYASTANPATWVTAHWMLAVAGTVVVAVAFLVQGRAVAANYEVINRILHQVEAIRQQRQAAAAAHEDVASP